MPCKGVDAIINLEARTTIWGLFMELTLKYNIWKKWMSKNNKYVHLHQKKILLICKERSFFFSLNDGGKVFVEGIYYFNKTIIRNILLAKSFINVLLNIKVNCTKYLQTLIFILNWLSNIKSVELHPQITNAISIRSLCY